MELIARRYRPLTCIGKTVIVSHVGELAAIDLETKKIRHICDLPVGRFKKLLSRIRIFERLLRTEAKIAVPVSAEEIVVSYRGGVYRVNINSGEILRELSYRNGMNGPMRIAGIKNVKGFSDCLAFGEYTLNPQRKNPSAIFTRDSCTGEWKKVFEFKPGTVRHIHGLTPDAENGCVYILTGDFKEEAGIWKATENFARVEPMLTGSQTYRSGYLFKTEQGYTYATDTALEQNYLYCIDVSDCSLKPYYEMDGSCVSSAETKDKVLFSSTVEADESVRGWRSWINMKRGAGIKSEYAKLVVVDKKTLAVKVIAEYKKDKLPFKLFQYGYVKVVDAPAISSILAYPVGVKKYDAALLRFGYEELE